MFDAFCEEDFVEELEGSDESEVDHWCGLDPRNIIASRTRVVGDG